MKKELFNQFREGQITLPQTDNTRTIEVNVYDAKLFLGRIQSQIDFFEQIVDRPNEAKHWKTLLESAKELLNVNQEP